MTATNREFDVNASQRKLDEQAKQIKDFRKTLNTIRKNASLRRRDLLLQSIPLLRSAFRSS